MRPSLTIVETVQAGYGRIHTVTADVPVEERWKHGHFKIQTWAMHCCGLCELTSFAGVDRLLEEGYTPAEIFAGLCKAQSNAPGSYQPWNVLYTITEHYLNSPAQQMFVEHGAVQMGDGFPNLAHGPNTLHVWRFNLKNVVGKLITADGDIITQQPAKEPA